MKSRLGKIAVSISKTTLIAAAVAPLFQLSPTALASNRPNWAQEFVGEVNFELNDDPKLKEHNQTFKFANERLKEITAELQKKSEMVAKHRQDFKTIAALVIELQQKSLDALKEKNNLTEQAQKIREALPELNDKLTLAITTQSAQAQKVAEVEANITRIEQNLAETKTQCETAPSPECEKKLENITTRLSNQKEALDKARELLNLANEQLASAKTKVEKQTERLQETTKRMAQIDQENSERARELVLKEKEKATLNNRLELAITEAREIENEQRNRAADLANVERAREEYRQSLINKILDVNRDGARLGMIDGSRDGLEMAQEVGMNQGDRDGSQDGRSDGIGAGMRRDFERGFEQGQIDGSNRAEREGEENGREDGSRQGNIDAAEIEGAKAGAERARNSDASVVGRSAGESAGLGRADKVGREEGSAAGEAQAIKKHEGSVLKNLTISGEFAGAFGRVVPHFGGGRAGPSYRDRNDSFTREVVQAAYRAGYQSEYNRFMRMEYDRNIGAIYDNAYQASYQYFYENHFNVPYEAELNRGQREGETQAYQRDYAGIYNSYFSQFRTTFASSPNRESTEYKQTFSTRESESYTDVYYQIRNASYRQAEVETFDQNIASKREFYREARFKAVEAVYQKHAVLKYVTSDLVDGGINSVAAKDGIVMPGEVIFYNIKVKNFGDTAASASEVQLASGAKFKLPAIPAKSEVTIKGAAKALASERSIGTKESQRLAIMSPLLSGDKVEGRHFQSTAESLVASETLSHTLAYPLSLSALKLSATPILGQSANLSVSVANHSSRSHQGPIEVVLSDDAKGKVISKGFSSLSKIDSTATLSDAKFASQDESDAYRPITIRAKLVQNGVTLGTLNAPLTTMIKAKYSERSGAPVVLVNSDSSARELLNVMSELGGLSKASVLDLSLKSLNSSALAGTLKNKTFIAIAGGGMEKEVQSLLAKSTGSALITVDGTRAAAEALIGSSLFKGAHQYAAKIAGVGSLRVASSNRLMNKALASDLNLLEGDLDQLAALVKLAELYKLGASDLLTRIGTVISDKNILALPASGQQLLQVANARMFDEILRANTAYRADVVESKHIREDKSTLLYKFAAIVDTSSTPTSKNVGLFVSAIDSYETLAAMVDKSSIGKPVHMNVHAYIFGSPLVWNYATEAMNKAYKALGKYDKNIASKIRNRSRTNSPIALDRLD